MFFKSDSSFQQFIINNIKKNVEKTRVMCSIITDVEMVLLNHLMIIFIAIKTIDNIYTKYAQISILGLNDNTHFVSPFVE